MGQLRTANKRHNRNIVSAQARKVAAAATVAAGSVAKRAGTAKASS